MKTLLLTISVLLSFGCSDANVVSNNISRSAEMFEIDRRIVFYNGITNQYILVIEGKCSLNLNSSSETSVICKTGNDSYVKHYLGLSDNVTYFAEQLESASVSADNYKVIFKPSAIIPDIDLH